MPEVKQERTHWRDEGLSERHRRWGWDCPATDIDFLMLEYDNGKASAIIEYKHERAQVQYASHPTYRAMIDLGNRAGLPVIACRYSDDYEKYKAVALNNYARKYLPERKEFDEEGWVRLLYEIRGRNIPEDLLCSMNTEI